MLAPRRFEFISRSPDLDITVASNAFAAQTKRITLPSNAPIEEIRITFQLTLNATSTWVNWGPLGILKRVTLNVNPGSAYDAVYCDGPGLLALGELEGLGHDRSTRQAIVAYNAGHSRLSEIIATPSGAILRVTYRIPMVHPLLTGALRLRSLVDCINHRQDPVLTIDVAASSELTATATPISAAACEVVVVRRDISADVNRRILDTGGYLKSDLRTTAYDLPTSLSNVERRFAVPSPGDYLSLSMIQLAGAAAGNSIPYDLSASTAVGSETQWRLEAGGSAIQSWRMKHLAADNDFAKSVGPTFQNLLVGDGTAGYAINSLSNLGVSGGAPPIFVTSMATAAYQGLGGLVTPGNQVPYAGLHIQDPAIVGFDFLTDGLNDAGELGSALNANFASDAIRWEIVGNVTTPSGQTSLVTLTGRRYRDSVEKFKALPQI